MAYGSQEDGYLLGSNINGVFIPTHFAPFGLKRGVRLIKDLVDSDTPTALFVTEDLADTVKKINGWKVFPKKFNTQFRGDDVKKTLVVSKWSALTRLAVHQAREVSGELRWRMNEVAENTRRQLRRNRANANRIENELEEALDDDGGYAVLGEETLAKLRESNLTLD